MCRHLAYLGPPRPLSDVLLAPTHGLLRQSWQPRRQTHGAVNADGFGVGWYLPGDPQPARYRRDRPIWSDANLVDLARSIRSGAVLAAVRSATDGMGHAESAAAPFRGRRWLFSHNGAVPGWPESVVDLARRLPIKDVLGLDAATDSALIWACLRRRLEDGTDLGTALSEVVADVLDLVPDARLNLLVTDGTSVAATAVGHTLCWRTGADCVLVASEPVDDGPDWQDVPDRSLLVARPGQTLVTPLRQAYYLA